MWRVLLLLISIVLASTLSNAQANEQRSETSPSDVKSAFAGNAPSCLRQEPERLVIPEHFAAQAKLRVRLLNLLRESLRDDAKGIVNIARENEIKKLASSLKKQ